GAAAGAGPGRTAGARDLRRHDLPGPGGRGAAPGPARGAGRAGAAQRLRAAGGLLRGRGGRQGGGRGGGGGGVAGAFIRAPWVADAGPEVEVLAEVEGKVVAVRQGNLLATAFHPELSGEVRLHRWLVDLIAERSDDRVAERGPSWGGIPRGRPSSPRRAPRTPAGASCSPS